MTVGEKARGHLQRVPPHDLGTERALLGAALVGVSRAAAEVVASIGPEPFYKPAHAHVAAAIRTLVNAADPVDPTTVSSWLRQAGLLDAVGGNGTLIELQGAGGTSSAAAKYADDVTGLHRKRLALTLLADGVEAIYSNLDISSLVSRLGEVAADDLAHRVSSWEPVNLAAILAGEGETPELRVMARSDNVLLLYAGKIHMLNAEPEAGKTWVALAASAQELVAGRHVLFVDFEGDAVDIVGRLLELGVTPAVVLERFHYVRPDDPMDAAGRLRLGMALDAFQPSLAILDGVTEAMVSNGWSIKDNDDVARFFIQLARPLARTGAAVLVLDHVTKDRETRGRWAIGGQHKMAGVDGATLSLEVVKPFSRGNSGQSRLYVQKDRHGKIRPLAIAQRLLADVHFAAHADRSGMTVTLGAPTDSGDQSFRPTGYMERISKLLEEWPDAIPATRNAINKGVHGKATVVDAALRALITEGFVTVEAGPRKALLHRVVRPFRESDSDPSEPVDNYDEEPF